MSKETTKSWNDLLRVKKLNEQPLHSPHLVLYYENNLIKSGVFSNRIKAALFVEEFDKKQPRCVENFLGIYPNTKDMIDYLNSLRWLKLKYEFIPILSVK